MKFLALVLFVVGSTTALRSGPYLPSGWRPSGPSFYLPSEVKNTSPIPLKDSPVESEAEGSDFLREYGPPRVQEVSQDLTEQALPEVGTEQPFVLIDARFSQETVSAVGSDASLEQNSAVTEDTSTPTAEEENSTFVSEVQPSIQGKSLDTEVETIVEETSQSSVATEVIGKERKEVEVKRVEEGVKNIADALLNLEKEVKGQQNSVNLQMQAIKEVKELKTVADGLGSVPPSESLLEYGPPGFREYGPPKHEDLLRSNLVAEDKSSNAAIETNENRRRRFSPKLRAISRRKH